MSAATQVYLSRRASAVSLGGRTSRPTLTSNKADLTFFHANFSPPAEYWSSPCSRWTTKVFSSSVRNFAVSGKSWQMKKEAMPATKVMRPSMMNCDGKREL